MCEQNWKHDECVLNLHCSNCGSSAIVKTNKSKIVKNEIGMLCKDIIYKCNNCNAEFLICPECAGSGFRSNLFMKEYQDCEMCYGMGVISTKKFENSI